MAFPAPTLLPPAFASPAITYTYSDLCSYPILEGAWFISYLRSLVALGLPGTSLSDQLQRGLVL